MRHGGRRRQGARLRLRTRAPLAGAAAVALAVGGAGALAEVAAGAEVHVDGLTIRYVAGPGETNDVRVEYWIEDVLVPLTAGPGCESLTAHRVQCTVVPPSDAVYSVDLGDGDDRVSVALHPLIRTTLLGGAGTDTLLGGASADWLDGGPGGDVLLGGADAMSHDTVDYSARTASVTVDADGEPGDDGEAGEGDTVGADVEDLVGGSGADVLIGNQAENVLVGGLGADVLRGGDRIDTVDYASRTSGVRVSLDGVADDGAAGEGDLVAADIERVFTGSGDDTLVGSDEVNDLRSGDGRDSIHGGGAEDSIDSGPDADDVDGGEGRDYITTGAGDDVVHDVTSPPRPPGAQEPDFVDAGEGDDAVDLGAEGGTIHGGPGDDHLRSGLGAMSGGDGDDELVGGDGYNTLVGGAGTDVLLGGGGWDRVAYEDRTEALHLDVEGDADDGAAGEGDRIGSDVEELAGGSGDDTIVGGDGPNIIDGREGDNVLTAGGGDDVVTSYAGVDVVDAGPGNDRVSTGGNADVVALGPGDDWLDWNGWQSAPAPRTVTGGSGDDTLGSRPGAADDLDGGEGRDTVDYSVRYEPLDVDLGDAPGSDGAAGEGDILRGIEDVFGGHDADRLTGNAADNLLRGGTGTDTIAGGGGTDVSSYSDHVLPVIADLDGESGDDGQRYGPWEADTTLADVEGLVGGYDADVLIGNDGANSLAGLQGDDLLVAGAGPDTLDGGEGDDVLDGGPGADALGGGPGADDVADYSDRTTGVVVDLGDPGLDGGPPDAPGDSIAADVEDVWSGTGADVLRGSAAANLLDGGLGADVLAGGGGFDVVDYSLREAPVAADPDGAPGDDGEVAEGDTIAPDVEGLTGGSGNDVLAGNALENAIFAGAGDDAVDVRDGGYDLVDCSYGSDQATADAGDELISCAPEPKPRSGPQPSSPPRRTTPPAPGPPPAPLTPPVRLASLAGVGVDRRQRVVATVRCAAESTSPCAGTLSVIVSRRRPGKVGKAPVEVRLARKAVELLPGKSTRATLALRADWRSFADGGGVVRAVVRLRVSRLVVERTVVLRALPRRAPR